MAIYKHDLGVKLRIYRETTSVNWSEWNLKLQPPDFKPAPYNHSVRPPPLLAPRFSAETSRDKPPFLAISNPAIVWKFNHGGLFKLLSNLKLLFAVFPLNDATARTDCTQTIYGVKGLPYGVVNVLIVNAGDFFPCILERSPSFKRPPNKEDTRRRSSTESLESNNSNGTEAAAMSVLSGPMEQWGMVSDSFLVHSNPEPTNLAGDIVLCSWASHFAFTGPGSLHTGV